MKCQLFLFFFLVGLASSSATTHDEIGLRGLTGRSLLQQKTNCPIDFENQNYTIITSQCKGPNYGKLCCTAFKEFACKFRDNLNDMKSNCASTMFSYINLYGKYPPGLFANLCVEAKEGLDCTEHDKMEQQRKQQEEASKNDAPTSTPHRSATLLMAASSLILLWNIL